VYGGLAILSCLLLLLILSLGVQLPTAGLITWGPLELFITLVLTALAGVNMGLLLSSLNRQASAVIYMVLAVLYVQILLGCVLFKMEGPLLESVSLLTITRWSLEGLGATTHVMDRNTEGEIVVHTQIFNIGSKPPIRLPGEFGNGMTTFPMPSALGFTY